MSKRAKAKDMLSGIDAQFQTPQAAKQKEPEYRRKTYLLNDELVKRMATLAAAHRVGINDMARFLLDHVLTMAEEGQIEIETEVIDATDRPGYTKTVIAQ